MSSPPEPRPPLRPREPRASEWRVQLLALLSFVLVSVAAVWWMTMERVHSDQAEAISREIEHNESLVLAHEEQVRLVLRPLDEALLYAASDTAWLDRALASQRPEPAAWRSRGGMEVGLLKAAGDEAGNMALDLAPERQQRLLEHHRRVQPLSAYVSPTEGGFSTLSRGIPGTNGRLAAVLFIRLEPQTFLDFFQKAELQPNDVLAVIGTEGESRARRSGADLSTGGDHRDSELVLAASRHPDGSLVVPSPIDGVQRFYSYRAMPDYGIIAVVGTAYDRVMAPVAAQARRHRGFAALTTLIILLGGAALASSIARQARNSRLLAHSESRFRALAQLSADWFWETDAQHQFTLLGAAGAGGALQSQVLARFARSPGQAPTPGPLARLFGQVRPEMDARQPFRNLEYAFADPPGPAALFLVSGEPMFDTDRRFLGYRGVAREVTRERQAQAARATSEARLAGIVETVMDAIITVDGRQRILLFNQAAARMFRCDAPSAIGYALQAFLPACAALAAPQDRPGADGSLSGAWRGVRRMQALRVDGVAFEADVSLSQVEVGSERLFTVVVRDVTDQIAADAALRERAESYRLLFETMKDAVLLAGQRHEVLEINPAACRLLGVPRLAALGRPVGELLGERAELDALLASCGLGESGELELTLDSASGRNLHLELTCSAFLDGQGRRRLNVLIHDLTARVEAQAAQEAMSARLRNAEKLESLGRLAGGVAHDFNNFIAAILGNAGLAQMRATEPAQVLHYVQEIQRASLNAQQVVQKVMTFSQQRAPSIAQKRLGEVVERAVDMLRPTLPEGVALSLSGAVDPGEVLCDEVQIHQVIMNLGSNAWQAMPRRQGHIEISVQQIDAQNEMLLTVQDDGAGMDQDTRQRLFEPFFTTKPMGEGTGLGLAVVHGIVQAHRGHIHVSSLPALGCRVEIYLPRCDPASAPAEPEGPGTHAGSGAQAAAAPWHPEAPPAAVRPRLVYVDDYDVMAKMTRAMLNACGMEVTVFLDGSEALEFVRDQANAIDVFVTDYNMPVMSGLELAARVRRLRPTLPIIVSSGYITPALIEGAHGCGVNAVADKTAGVGELEKRIREALRSGE